MARRKTKDALEIIDHMIGNDHEMREMIEQELVNAQVAGLIYEARAKARLTQSQLAELIGTSQPVIARLEDADYRGHSLTMLKRIAQALGKRVVIRLAPAARGKRSRAVA